MDAIHSTIARARFRLMLQGALHWLGWLLLAGAAVAVLLVLADRLLAWPMPIWAYGVVAGAAVAGALVLAYLRRPSEAHTAWVLDERLGLKDRLGTALFAESLKDDPLAQHVVSDAQHTAANLRYAAATPIRFGKVWAWVPPMVAVALMFFIEPTNLFGKNPADQRQAQENADKTRDRIVQATSMIKEISAEQKNPDKAADPSQIMKELASISQQDLTNPNIQRKTQAKLSELREQLDNVTESKKKSSTPCAMP